MTEQATEQKTEQVELTPESLFNAGADALPELRELGVDKLPEGLRRLAHLIAVRRFDQPVSGKRLARILVTDTRTISASVEELIIKHRLPIGSTRGAPAGYYWIRTADERDAACAMLHNTAMKLLFREQALKRITNDQLLNQIRMSLEEGDDA